jgi:polysaccharide biosynthesis transport protein
VPPDAPGAEPQGHDAGDPVALLTGFLRIVRKHWAIAAGVAASIFVATVFYTQGQTRIYQSSATLEFELNPHRPLGKDIDAPSDLNPGFWSDAHEYYETQRKIIASVRVAEGVVRALDLAHDPGFLYGARAPRPGSAPVTEEAAARILVGRLSVNPVKDTSLAVVTYEDTDSARAQRILGGVVDTYMEQNIQKALVASTAAVGWLRGQHDTLKNDLESSEMSLHDYKLNKNILSLDIDAQSNMLREEMRQINDTLTSARTRREELSARRSELSKIAAGDPNILPATELLQSPLLQQLRQRYEEAVRERDGLLGSGRGRNHPEVQAADARAMASKDALVAEVRNIQAAVERDVAVVNRQADGLAKLAEDTKKQALNLNLLEIEYNRLKRTKEQTEKLYSLVLERTKENDLARMMRVNNVNVVDRPSPADFAIRPRVSSNLAFGLVGGILLGLLAAYARGLFDRTLKTPEDIEKGLGLAFLGLMPVIGPVARPGKRGSRQVNIGGPPELAVHHRPTAGPAEAARTIRTNLILMDAQNPYKTILVTSAVPAEGKTTVACGVAISLASTGQSVVLVDCDLRRPRMHRIFRVPDDVGVSSILTGKSTIEQAVRPTEVPRLSVLPFGPSTENLSELLHGERFRQLIDDLSKRFDRVLIDNIGTANV